MNQPSVLMLEFNELAPRLMDRFIAEGHLPNFARLRDESTVTITDPEESQEGLEPWIQWVTVHTGVSRAEHGLEKLGEASRLNHPTIGQAVSAAGGHVWLCGSMNLPRKAAGDGTFLPDPWNPDSTPRPESLAAFSSFVRSNVQEHSNTSASQSPVDLARFGAHQLRHGLRLRTVRHATRQLLNERRGLRGRWARASVLDRLQWDVFRSYWKRDRPAFATFFSNSTAHYQHVFWRNLEPERFTNKPTAEEQRKFGDAVLYGYQQMDELVGEAMSLVDEVGATLMLCTALSQQPFLRAEESGGKYIYRPHDFDGVVTALGIVGVSQVAPVMAEQFHLFFEDASAALAGAEVLQEATVEGASAFSVRVVDNDVFAGCAIHEAIETGATLRTAEGRDIPFDSLFYRSEAAKSGFHHPDGIWWTRTGSHEELAAPVSLRRIAPTVLELLAVQIPETMTAPPLREALRSR
ncbi:hypothetical protein [Actinospongicola halichondriae]|uniref:hypothetical protein n=1 Tax=Actinospongicola halichondriae TaxID=3236844 RepID=UPI003D50A0E7